ncbi:MAG: glutathione S-transferase N-terminal domain-containing protein [Myxococcales bacterium]|nr:glutathione S-transferase N-terminal domain-containing protein [Myxococcales bacterium]
MRNPIRLLTIPFSHYCEKARWALDRAGVRYVEEGHLPLFHTLPVKRAGGRRTVPVLVTPHRVLDDSTDILRWCDLSLAPSERLFPQGLDAEVHALETRFDESLGPATRRWGYGLLLPQRALLLRALDQNVPRYESFVARRSYPLLRAALTRGLNLRPEAIARSAARTRALFDEVAARLSDGRGYLVGAQLTAADVAFASLAAPVLMPPAYTRYLVPFDALPDDFAEIVHALRAHPAGAFAMRLYDTHRSPARP